MRKLLSTLIIIIGTSNLALARDNAVTEPDPQIKPSVSPKTSAITLTEANPSKLMENIAVNMIASIEENKDTLKKNNQFAEDLVRKNLVPVLDMTTFSRRTLGSKIWKSISPRQQKDFIDNFLDRVIGKYAKFLVLYDGQIFEFAEARYSKSKRGAIVKSTMKQTGEAPLDIHYRLSNKSGNWLVTNIIISGTDMRKSYRTQFLPRINALGIDKFDQFIEELNAPPEKLTKK